MREFQQTAEEPAAGASPVRLPAAGSAAVAQVLALQRTAGNRATAQLLARIPEFRPDDKQEPSKDNPWPDCTPFPFEHEAISAWKFWMNKVNAPERLKNRCDCSLVGDAYRDYLNATGGRRVDKDDGNCISDQCAKDDAAHKDLEERLLKQWHDQGPVAEAALAGGRSAELDLVKALEGSFVAPQTVPFVWDVTMDITFKKNTLAGGLLFGGGAPEGETSSNFGRDTRWVSGTIKLERTDNGENPNFIDVKETVVFNYTVDDALDFCPGNTLRKDNEGFEGWAYNEFLSDMSRLEASGMTKDIGFHVEYHRTHTGTHSIRRTPR
jgi:hypothetical protein